MYHLSSVAMHAHPLIERILPHGCGLIQQDNVTCHKELTESVGDILVADTKAHLQGSSGIHASLGQRCLGGKGGTNTTFGRWLKCNG